MYTLSKYSKKQLHARTHGFVARYAPLRDDEKVNNDRFIQRLKDGSKCHVWILHRVQSSVKARKRDVIVVRINLTAAGVNDLEAGDVMECRENDDDDDLATLVLLVLLKLVLVILFE